jgi:hypothetical protein
VKLETYEVLAKYVDTWGLPRFYSPNYWYFFRLDRELTIYFYDEGPILYIEHWVDGVKHDLR